MADSAELIEWHYSKPGSDKKDKLIEHLITCWTGIKKQHLQKNLESILKRDKNGKENRPLILLLTMRNRKRMGEEIKKRKGTENGFSGLKQLLTHLGKQGDKPFIEDECTRAILRDKNYSTKVNHATMFQIERIRRIRAKSKPTNHNLDFCVKILNTLQTEDDDDPHSAILISSKSLRGLLMLQRALCFARTASYADTIEFAELSENNYKSNNKEITQLIKLHIWWTYEVRERTFARCFMIKERKKWRNKANKILSTEIDGIKTEYLDSLRPDANGVLEEKKLFKQVLRLDYEDDYVPNMDHHLYSYHILLSRYLKYSLNVNLKEKFDKKQIHVMFDTTSPKEGEEEWLKDISRYKKEMNQFLSHGITGDSGKDSSTRAQPLLYNHTSLKESVLIKRMKKCCISAILLVQSANERHNSYLILQLTLVAIDLLAKLDRLAQLIIRVDKKRRYILRAPEKNKPKNNSINTEDVKHIKSLMQKVFHKIKKVMHKELTNPHFPKGEVPLFDWISGMSSLLEKLEIIEGMKGLTEIQGICKKATMGEVKDNTSDSEYHGEILLHFLTYEKDEVISDNEKTINFFAHFLPDDGEPWTPYSLIPGEAKFSDLKE